jgi:predicted permease
VATIAGRFAQENPTVYRPGSGFMGTTLAVRDELTRNARPMLFILLGTTGLVLLIACANVASLTLARLLRRDRELAVRAALGAGRARLVRQLLTESVLLALAGGVVGLVFARWTIGLLATFVGRFTPRAEEIAIEPRVLLFTLVLATITGVLFGTVPAFASRVDLAQSMKQGSKGSGETASRRRIQGALIAAQVAVSVVLLVAAGLLLTSFYRLQSVDPGYRGDRVLTAEVFTNFSQYPDADAQLGLYLPLLERIQSQPGVVSAAISNAVPLSTVQPGSTPFLIEGLASDDADRRPGVDARVVSERYFDTLGIPVIRGRSFTTGDGRDTQRVATINQAMARFFEGRDPIGSRISLDGQTWLTVVGVVGNVRQFGLDRQPIAQVYTPLTQTRQGLQGLVLVRTNGQPGAAAALVRSSVRAFDPNMPVENVRSLDEIRERYLATPRLTAMLLSIFAMVALVVTMAGVTGSVARSVSQRTLEFGVRMALGASRRSVLSMVLRQGMAVVGAGLLVGIGAAVIFTRVLSSYLYDTHPADPRTLAGVALAFVVAAAIACIGPAWRATTVDPMTALRVE